MKCEIREARPADSEIIASFNSRMAEETEGRKFNPDVIGPGVANLLENVSSGVFTALYRHVESAARENDVRGLRLYVEQGNRRAQTTYPALGMVSPNYQVMESIFGDAKC